jgi:hypothetical protein
MREGGIQVRVSKFFSFCLFAATLSSAASAEVYQSKDAQGNTVFSDTPSQGAEAVKVSPTNSADPVAIPPRPPESEEKPAKPRKRTGNTADSGGVELADDDYLYYGDDYELDDVDERIRREHRRDNGETRPITDRPRVEPYQNTSRPAGGGRGRR